MSIFGELESPRDIDAAVRSRLASSLEHIFTRAKGRLEVDEARFNAAIEQIRTKRQDPGVFARYYDLIYAIGANQIAKANLLLNEIIDLAAVPISFEIRPYALDRLGSDYERFPRLLFSERTEGNSMAGLSDEQFETAKPTMQEALDIVAEVDKGIYDEINELLTRIYLAASSNDPSVPQLAGVTSFLVWGASFANIEVYATRWSMVEYLVHEITHSLLFGLNLDEPLVKNAPEEGYKSPLRIDLRPMDGLYHATLVCARLVDFNTAWLNSGLCTGADREQTEHAISRRMRLFHDGMAVIDEHGKLSDRGRELVERSRHGLSVLAA